MMRRATPAHSNNTLRANIHASTRSRRSWSQEMLMFFPNRQSTASATSKITAVMIQARDSMMCESEHSLQLPLPLKK